MQNQIVLFITAVFVIIQKIMGINYTMVKMYYPDVDVPVLQYCINENKVISQEITLFLESVGNSKELNLHQELEQLTN